MLISEGPGRSGMQVRCWCYGFIQVRRLLEKNDTSYGFTVLQAVFFYASRRIDIPSRVHARVLRSAGPRWHGTLCSLGDRGHGSCARTRPYTFWAFRFCTGARVRRSPQTSRQPHLLHVSAPLSRLAQTGRRSNVTPEAEAWLEATLPWVCDNRGRLRRQPRRARRPRRRRCRPA